MSVIAIINAKGGVGKTTITSNLAECFCSYGHSVLAIDADTQGSLKSWYSIGKDKSFEIIAMDTPKMFDRMPSFIKSYDFTIIDCSPRIESLMGKVIKNIDIAVIPILPCGYD